MCNRPRKWTSGESAPAAGAPGGSAAARARPGRLILLLGSMELGDACASQCLGLHRVAAFQIENREGHPALRDVAAEVILSALDPFAAAQKWLDVHWNPEVVPVA